MYEVKWKISPKLNPYNLVNSVKFFVYFDLRQFKVNANLKHFARKKMYIQINNIFYQYIKIFISQLLILIQ